MPLALLLCGVDKVRLTGGERMAVFNSAVAANDLVVALRRAQAEAEVVCFF